MEDSPETTAVTVTQKDYEALANFRYALRRFLRFSETAAASIGLTPQQYQGLLAIRGFGGESPITVGELAERLQLRPHSAVALVDRLVRQDLVARRASLEDRRQVYVLLTEHGTQVLQDLAWVHREELRRLEPRISEMGSYLRGENVGPDAADHA